MKETIIALVACMAIIIYSIVTVIVIHSIKENIQLNRRIKKRDEEELKELFIDLKAAGESEDDIKKSYETLKRIMDEDIKKGSVFYERKYKREGEVYRQRNM